LTQTHQLTIVFRDSDKHIKAAAINSGSYMNKLLGKCVGLISGEEWRRVRSAMELPFAHQATSNRAADIERQIVKHFQHLHTHGRLEEEVLHPAEDMKMLPFWVVCEMLYGRLPPPLLQELSDLTPLRERIFRYVIQGGLTRFTWSQWLPTVANAELRTFQRRWKAFNNAAHTHALEHYPSAPIVQMYDAIRSRRMTEDQLLQTLDESLYANLDVTTGGLSWNLVFLGANPDVQGKLRSEMQGALREGRLHEYARKDSTYLAACGVRSNPAG
jgi:cytochrome P450